MSDDQDQEQKKAPSKKGCLIFIVILFVIAGIYSCINPSPDAASRARIDGANKAIEDWNKTATPEQRRAVENFGN